MKILQSLVGQIFEVSLAAGLVIAILLLIRPILGKRYQSKTFYWIWLLISLRLAIPVNFSIFPALININATDTVLIQSASPEADDTALSGIEPVSQQDVADDSDSMQTAPAENILTVGQLVSIIWISGAGIFLPEILLNICGSGTRFAVGASRGQTMREWSYSMSLSGRQALPTSLWRSAVSCPPRWLSALSDLPFFYPKVTILVGS